MGTIDPPRGCSACPRISTFLDAARATNPDWYNGPVPSFGDAHAPLLIVGLAPGLQGANRTGRPFTGDHAGELLYRTLLEYGLATGRYEARADDGLQLVDCAITNAVRCVPPQNKPLPAEIKTCNAYLAARLAGPSPPRAIVALGRIAHDATLSALNVRKAAYPFAHGARHALPNGIALHDCYHCSRYNTNTGVLTPEMFRAVFAAAKAEISASG